MQNSISTAAFAAQMQIKAESVLRRLSVTGSYFGIRPEKLPNGRLEWPENPRELLKNKSQETA